ncbi:MAG: hypothetical protein ACXWLH_01540 [Candidatus Saccharimonadales bacterium]
MEQLACVLERDNTSLKSFVLGSILKATKAAIGCLDRPTRQWSYRHEFPAPTLGVGGFFEYTEDMDKLQQIVANLENEKLS